MMAEYVPAEKSASDSASSAALGGFFGRAIWTIGVKVVCGTGHWLAQSLMSILKSCQKKQLAIDPDELEQMVGPTMPSLSQRIKQDLEQLESMEDEDGGLMETDWEDLLRQLAEDGEDGGRVVGVERVDEDELELTNESLDHYLFYRYQRPPPAGARNSL